MVGPFLLVLVQALSSRAPCRRYGLAASPVVAWTALWGTALPGPWCQGPLDCTALVPTRAPALVPTGSL